MLFRVWSINTKNNQMLWLMGEYTDMHEAMERAEQVVFNANPDAEELRFEQTFVKDKRTEAVEQGVMCMGRDGDEDGAVGSVITGVTTQHLENMSQWPGYEEHDEALDEFEQP